MNKNLTHFIGSCRRHIARAGFILLQPVKINMRGLKKLKLHLFPRIRFRLFSAGLTLRGGYSYGVVVGA